MVVLLWVQGTDLEVFENQSEECLSFHVSHSITRTFSLTDTEWLKLKRLNLRHVQKSLRIEPESINTCLSTRLWATFIHSSPHIQGETFYGKLCHGQAQRYPSGLRVSWPAKYSQARAKSSAVFCFWFSSHSKQREANILVNFTLSLGNNKSTEKCFWAFHINSHKIIFLEVIENHLQQNCLPIWMLPDMVITSAGLKQQPVSCRADNS